MVIRTAHHEVNDKLYPLIDKTFSPIDAEFIKYIMYQDMEFGGSRNQEDMRIKSLLRRYKNFKKDIGEENFIPINEAIEKAVKSKLFIDPKNGSTVSGVSKDLKEVAGKKKLLFPLYVATCICILENFKLNVCKQVFADVERAVESIKQPSLLDKLYNREL